MLLYYRSLNIQHCNNKFTNTNSTYSLRNTAVFHNNYARTGELGRSGTRTSQATLHTTPMSDSEFDVVCYIPCHFDFSQVEHVAPFLERFGGKVFVYKWNGMKDKMIKYYSENYGRLPRLYILNEKKKVVFLLTASMAYPFGAYQRSLLQIIQNKVPDRVAAVSVIGHCLYGCMSCKGADHKIPVYFSRYFNNKLPYTSDDVKKQYQVVNPSELTSTSGPVTVLVAPSTGETSMLIQKDILDHLWKLQHSGRYRFIWKLHPTVFNLGGYDMTYAPHKSEVDNVQFILKNFTVTHEQQPSLLPFMKAFDVVLCDLHSTVPFVASYFSPKVIIAYHNDADYEAERDPKFLGLLSVFQQLSELEPYLATLPPAKGDRSFFHSVYGHVDGREELRFAALSNWPKSIEKILHDAISKKEDETEADCKQAMGLDITSSLNLDEWTSQSIGLINQYTIDPSMCSGLPHIRIMSFNLWHGGEHSGYPLTKTIDVIKHCGADVVGIQESAGMPDAQNSRRDNTKAIADMLGWNYYEQGIVMPGKGNVNPFSIITRWKILSATPLKWGVKIQMDNGSTFYMFNTHLSYFPYQPYQVLSIPYENTPFLKSEEEVIESSLSCRKGQLDSLIQDIQQATSEGVPVFVTGDFNEPSFLDWTCNTALAGVHPMPIRWPVTKKLSDEGLLDVSNNNCQTSLQLWTYRVSHRDEVAKPGFTWTTLRSEDDPTDHADRIDYIFMGGKGAKLLKSEVVGESKENAEVVVTPWPSDHRAVLSTFVLHP